MGDVTHGTIEVSRVLVRDREVVVIRLIGEHDLVTAPELRVCLAAVAIGVPLAVDASACTFADSSILGALVAARRGRGAFAVAMGTDEGSALRRALAVTGLDAVLVVTTSADDALERVACAADASADS